MKNGIYLSPLCPEDRLQTGSPFLLQWLIRQADFPKNKAARHADFCSHPVWPSLPTGKADFSHSLDKRTVDWYICGMIVAKLSHNHAHTQGQPALLS
jgi:hypothetical protein